MEFPAVKQFLESTEDDGCLVLVQDYCSKSGLTYCNQLVNAGIPVCLGYGNHRFFYSLGGIKVLPKILAENTPHGCFAVAELRDFIGGVKDEYVLLARQVDPVEWLPIEQEETCPSCRKEATQQQEAPAAEQSA